MDQCLSELGTQSIDFRFDTTNDPFNVETGALPQSMWAEAFGDRVPLHDHADRAGPVHRPRARRRLQRPPGPGVRRSRPRPAAVVVAEGIGDPDRQAGAQHRTHLRRRDRRGVDDHQVEPRPRGAPSSGRDDQPALRRTGLLLVVELDAVGHRHPAVRQRHRAQRPARRHGRGSAWPSPAATRSTRSGATTAAASDRGGVDPVGPRRRSAAFDGRPRSHRPTWAASCCGASRQ